MIRLAIAAVVASCSGSSHGNDKKITSGTLDARAWLDKDRIVLVDAVEPPHAAEAYVRVLGEPEAKLDYTWRDGTIEKAEWVWPSRGVMVAASPEVKGVMRIGIFAPTTMADYQRDLRFFDRSRDAD